MFPDPQDALPLPLRPNLEQYKKRAKDLTRPVDPGDSALTSWTQHWVQSLLRRANLTLTPGLPLQVDRWIAQFVDFTRAQRVSGKLSLSKAQFILARVHGFESWPRFARQVKALGHLPSAESDFERVADAVVTGDIASLKQLLGRNPGLIRARSPRRHRATCLHYVSANGMEGYRQKTPPNVVAVARLLLDTGADVDATACVYGGNATTLALVATSIHPEKAGVQEELMQLLLDRGARLAGSRGKNLVSDCLANHRFPAAQFLASRGASLDLESAAGLGKLDVVRSHFGKNGGPTPPATRLHLQRGLFWACEYGHHPVVEFLLDHGASLNAAEGTGQTALHWAVVGAQLDTIKLLVSRGANLETRNTYGGTALGQALWGATQGDANPDHLAVIETLLGSGSQVEEGTLLWLNAQKHMPPRDRTRIAALLKQHGARSRKPSE